MEGPHCARRLHERIGGHFEYVYRLGRGELRGRYGPAEQVDEVADFLHAAHLGGVDRETAEVFFAAFDVGTCAPGGYRHSVADVDPTVFVVFVHGNSLRPIDVFTLSGAEDPACRASRLWAG